MSRTIELPDGTPHTFTDEELERGEAMMARLREVEASLVDDTGQTAYSEMLLPCPFCGGEARIIAKPYEPKVCVGCDDDTCLGFSGLGWLYDSDKEATEAWNRRAERTWHDFSDELPPVGVNVLCRGRNGALYVGKPVTFRGNGTRKVWVPRGDQYRTPEKWTEVEA